MSDTDMIKKSKEFDCVEMARRIRDKLSVKYANNPELEDNELKAAREKFKKIMQEKRRKFR